MEWTHRNLKQDVTRWAITPDGYGGYTYGTPEKLKGRWEGKVELVTNAAGVEVRSQAVVYLNSDVDEGDYICLGDLQNVSDPTTLPAARRVVAFRSMPDQRFVAYERKAWL